MKTVNEIQSEINRLEALKASIVDATVTTAKESLITEVSNLLFGCGAGFTEEDYYAPVRYYSKIDGVKNIRINEHTDTVILKVTSQKGALLGNLSPIKINDVDYDIEITWSNKASEEMDY